MNFKNLYKDLATELSDLGCAVYDFDFLGFCCFSKKKAFIHIRPSMSYRHKFYTLCHEMGHLFTMDEYDFLWSEVARTEKQANNFAVKLLKTHGITKEEYYVFYDKAVKRGRPRKTWSEL
jgi:Zn-dependent peptidase ImmA (M78 family)